ncbi:MAG: autotransporter-associated beta strand repeat-containing protein [Pirellulales bacterium]|nr:autotransporter-associated beta strand repeat-containing protein [Pirellulales bacterium]
MRKSILCAFIALGVVTIFFAAVAPATAQPRPGPPGWFWSGVNFPGVGYSNYSFRPGSQPFPNPVQFGWLDFEHAWAGQSPNPANYQVSPAGQPPGFVNYGYDRKATGSTPGVWGWPTDVWNSGNVGGGSVVAVNQNVTWPLISPSVSNTVSAVSGASTASATAGATVSSTGWPTYVSAGPWISGSSTGNAYKYASSTVQMYAGGWTVGGGNRWNLQYVWRWWLGGTSSVGGAAASGDAGELDEPEYDTGAHPPSNKYLAVVNVLRPDQTLLSQESLAESAGRIDWTTDGEEAVMEWGEEAGEGFLAVSNVEYGRFYADLTNECIDLEDRGMVDLRIHHGVVTTSRATGIFTGMLPPVGTPANFTIPFPIEGDFDFTLPDPGEDFDLRFDLCASDDDLPAVWTGDGADSNWSAQENWLYAAPPESNVSLYFSQQLPTGSSLSYNDLPPETQFNALVFRAETDVTYFLQGNSIILDGLVENSGIVTQIIDLDLVLPPEGATFDTRPGGLDIGGEISGPGSLTKTGPGTLFLIADNGYEGPTTINEGALELDYFAQIALSSGIENHASFRILCGDHTVSAITGEGTTEVLSGSLTTSSITQGTLVIGSVLAAGSPVPEPSTWILAALAGLGILMAIRRRR